MTASRATSRRGPSHVALTKPHSRPVSWAGCQPAPGANAPATTTLHWCRAAPGAFQFDLVPRGRRAGSSRSRRPAKGPSTISKQHWHCHVLAPRMVPRPRLMSAPPARTAETTALPARDGQPGADERDELDGELEVIADDPLERLARARLRSKQSRACQLRIVENAVPVAGPVRPDPHERPGIESRNRVRAGPIEARCRDLVSAQAR